MTYMQSNCIAFEHLSEEEVEYLNNVSDDTCFILVTDGDQSCQYEIYQCEYTLQEVLADISQNEDIVFSQDYYNEEQPILPKHFTRTKNYFNWEVVFTCGEE